MLNINDMSPEAISDYLTSRLQLETQDYNQLVDNLQNTEQRMRLQESLLSDLRSKTEEAVKSKQEALESLADVYSQNNKLNAEITLLTKRNDKLVGLEKELKALKALGDIKAVKRNLETKKADLVSMRKRADAKSKDCANYRTEVKKLTQEKFYLEEKLKLSGDSTIVRTDTGETVYMHTNKVAISDSKGKVANRVPLLYWHPYGVGRLVFWDGVKKKPSFADLENEGIALDPVLKPSDEIVIKITDWFTTNVLTAPNGEQTIKSR